jgi:hypothetical protein
MTITATTIKGVLPPSTTEVIDVESFQFSTMNTVINLFDDEDDADIRILSFIPKNTTF